MSVAAASTIALDGISGHLVDVQVDLSSGLVSTSLVGRPDPSVNEARDRCRAAITNSGYDWPATRRVTILLSPADLPKRGSHYDLAIAVSNLLDHRLADPWSLASAHVRGFLSMRDVPPAQLRVLAAAAAARCVQRALISQWRASTDPTRADYVVWRTATTRWRDDDAYGHLNNATYYELFDTAVNAYLYDATGLDVRSLPQIGVVAETGCRYFRELGFPEPIEMGLVVDKVGTSSIVSVNAACCSGLPHAADVVMGTMAQVAFACYGVNAPCCSHSFIVRTAFGTALAAVASATTSPGRASEAMMSASVLSPVRSRLRTSSSRRVTSWESRL